MKKIYYLLFLLPLSFLMACSDDFTPVDMTVTLNGVTTSGESFYTVEGEDVSVENLEVKSIDGKPTAYSNVLFYFNGVPLMGNPENPLSAGFSTEDIPAGTYTLSITGSLLQEDASLKAFAVNYPLVIVSSQDDLPAGAPEIGSYSQTIRISNK